MGMKTKMVTSEKSTTHEEKEVFRGYICKIGEDRFCWCLAEAKSPSRELQILGQLLQINILTGMYHLYRSNIQVISKLKIVLPTFDKVMYSAPSFWKL